MFHALKKRITLIDEADFSGASLPTEIRSLQLKLSLIKRHLSETIAHVEAANRRVKVQVAEQVVFSRAFLGAFPHEGEFTMLSDYPESSIVQALCFESESERLLSDFASQAELVYNAHCRAGSHDRRFALYKHMLDNVRGYIRAISSIEPRYSELVEAKSESLRYSVKFGHLISRGGVDDLKITRNLQKSDTLRKYYHDLRDLVLAQQNSLFARAPNAMKVAVALYWGTTSFAAEIYRETFQKTAAWAAKNQDSLSMVRIASLDSCLRHSSPATSDAVLSEHESTLDELACDAFASPKEEE